MSKRHHEVKEKFLEEQDLTLGKAILIVKILFTPQSSTNKLGELSMLKQTIIHSKSVAGGPTRFQRMMLAHQFYQLKVKLTITANTLSSAPLRYTEKI